MYTFIIMSAVRDEKKNIQLNLLVRWGGGETLFLLSFANYDIFSPNLNEQ